MPPFSLRDGRVEGKWDGGGCWHVAAVYGSVFNSQTRTVLSRLPETSRLVLGLKARPSTADLCPSNVARTSPVTVANMPQVVPFELPEVFLAGLRAVPVQ